MLCRSVSVKEEFAWLHFLTEGYLVILENLLGWSDQYINLGLSLEISVNQWIQVYDLGISSVWWVTALSQVQKISWQGMKTFLINNHQKFAGCCRMLVICSFLSLSSVIRLWILKYLQQQSSAYLKPALLLNIFYCL